jgi:hypothetical protein
VLCLRITSTPAYFAVVPLSSFIGRRLRRLTPELISVWARTGGSPGKQRLSFSNPSGRSWQVQPSGAMCHKLGQEIPSAFSMVRNNGRLSPTTLW